MDKARALASETAVAQLTGSMGGIQGVRSEARLKCSKYSNRIYIRIYVLTLSLVCRVDSGYAQFYEGLV